MRLREGAHRHIALALAGAALMVGTGCGGGSPVEPSPVPGATPVSGTERLAWTQAGDTSNLQFRAYVDDLPVALVAATCDASAPEAACTSPLPPLTDGVHTIALTSIFKQSGLESTPTAPLTVQKVSARSVTAATAFPDAAVRPGSLRLETVVTAANGLAFAVDIVARGLKAPAQLAWVPDGRLLVAEADGRVRVIRPGEPDRGEPALDAHDAHALLEPPPIGPLALASHPDFLRNHFVYVSFLAQERPDRTLLRIVRLREVGDTLGEPATLFEAPLIAGAAMPGGQRDGGAGVGGGPLMAFGPDGLLYVALPPGVEFDHEPAASRPEASMLRLSDDGRAPDVGPLPGVSAHPIGFTWHPSTGALWVVLPGENGDAVLRPITAGRTSGVAIAERVGLRMMKGTGGRSSGALVLQGAETGALDLMRAFLAAPGNDSPRIVRLTAPILAEGLLAGVIDRVGDVVVGYGGTLFLATNNAERVGGWGAAGAGAAGEDVAREDVAREDVIVRLRPRTR